MRLLAVYGGTVNNKTSLIEGGEKLMKKASILYNAIYE